MRLAVSAVLAIVGCPAIAYEYSVELLPLKPDWGTGPARYADLNNRGEVLGSAPTQGESELQAFVWQSGSFTRYPYSIAYTTHASRLNDRGEFAGSAILPVSGTVFTYLHRADGFQRIESPIEDEGNISIATLTNAGDTCGSVFPQPVTRSQPYAIIGGRFYLLPLLDGSMRRITETGIGIGHQNDFIHNTGRAFSWTPAGGIVFRPPKTHLNDVNDQGEIVGSFTVGKEAYALLERNGLAINLGPGFAAHINNRSEIVLDSTVERNPRIWRNGVASYLKSLVDPTFEQPDQWEVVDLNDRGQMLVGARYDNRPYAERFRTVVLTPVNGDR